MRKVIYNRITKVIAGFSLLFLLSGCAQVTAGHGSVGPSASPTATVQATATPTSTPIRTPRPTATPSPSASALPTVTFTDMATPENVVSPTPTSRPIPPSSVIVTATPRPNGGATKRIALTFDDGPSGSTRRIAAVLKQYQAKATFCVVGNRISSKNEALLRQLVEDGNEIASHSWAHTNLRLLTREEVQAELQLTNAAIEKATGVKPTFLRPPYGNTNDEVISAAIAENMAIVKWCVDPRDWESRDAEAVYNAIIGTVKDGDIVLCHDLYASTADAMERVIPKLIEDGFELVTVSELIGEARGEIVSGKIYRSARP